MDYVPSSQEDASKSSGGIFDLMFRKHNAVMLMIDAESGRILDANLAAEKFYGYSWGQLVSMSISDINMLDPIKVKQELQRALHEERNYFIFPHKLSNGQTRIVEVHSSPIADDNGRTFLFSIIHDITERKQVEDALLESEEKYRTLIDAAEDSIILTDLQGDRVFANPAYYKNLGYDLEDDVSKNGFDNVHPDDAAQVHNLLNDLINKGGVGFGSYRVRHKDGNWFYHASKSKLLYDKNNQPSSILTISRDITVLRQTQEKLQQEFMELELFHEGNLALSKLMNPKDLAQSLLDLMFQKLGWEYSSIRVFHSETNSLDLLAFHQPHISEKLERFTVEKRFSSMFSKAENSLGSLVIQRKQIVRIDDLEKDAQFSNAFIGLHSGLYVPIQLGDKLIGVMSIECEVPNRFTASDERVAATLATKMAISLENTRLFNETAQRAEEFSSLYETSKALSAETNLRALLTTIVENAKALLKTASSGMYLYDAIRDELELTVDTEPRMIIGTRLKMGEGVCGIVAKTRQPLRVDDYSNWESRSAKYEGRKIRAVLEVPMLYQGELIGVLAADEIGDSARKFTDADERLLSLFASQAAGAIHSARLREETVRRFEHLQALRSVEHVISSSIDLRLTLKILLNHTITQLGVDAASVLLLHPQRKVLQFGAAQGFRTRLIEGADVHLNDGYAGRAVMERRVVRVPDRSKIVNNEPFLQLWDREEFTGYICMPLIAKSEVKGVLEVYLRKPFNPDDEWLGFLETLAGQAAISVDNTQLFDNLQSANVELAIAYDATIEGWSHAMDLRDKETEGHTKRVTQLTLQLAKAMRIPDKDLLHVRRGALLHDIGKMGVPDKILLKPGKLTEKEWKIMRQHPVFAREMLEPIHYLRASLDIPYSHHEKWDGTGYPRGLKGEQIPLVARIFAIADVWDALTSSRPYRKAMSKREALAYIKKQKGIHFDPQVVDIFLKEIKKL
ncbi:MAG: GAF domain-containing protein [Anaerolineales bacterium]